MCIVATRLELCTYILYNSKGYIFEGAKPELVPVQLVYRSGFHTPDKGSCFSIKLHPLFNAGEVKMRYA